jgi:glutamate dehydrogenase (NAD(P)+)
MTMEKENPEITPEAVHSFFRSDGAVLGHLVVDSTLQGVSAGGIRMVPPMPIADLYYLARAMTLKYAFLKWPFGGAKAAIITHRDMMSRQDREQLVCAFAERLVPFKGRYLPGEDAGTNSEDLRLICRIAGLMRPRSARDTGFYTALTVRLCAEQVAAERGLALKDCRVAIEGLGKVGGSLAKQLVEIGCRIVAVSTDRGAVYDAEGLDVDRLLREREAVGSECVNRYDPSRRIAPSEVSAVEADFFMPCALSWSIDTSNADRVRAGAIVCGANNPVTEKARETLEARGVLYFPDFVSNSGGTLGGIVGTLALDHESIVRFIWEQFVPKIEHLMAHARRTKEPIEAAARQVAAANLDAMKQGGTRRKSPLFSWLVDLVRSGYVPGVLTRTFGPAYLRKTMS